MRRMEVWSPSRTQRYYRTSMALAVLLVLSCTGYVFLWKYRYDEGYSTGSEIGYEDGYGVGYDEGQIVGQKRGYDDGHWEGYKTGFERGKEVAMKAAYEKGVEEGRSIGHYSGYGQGISEGYDEGYLQAREDFGEGYYIRDPTLFEVRKFIKTDKTDREEYETGDYVCFDFATTFKRNAFSAGYMCYLVWIDLGFGAGHAINAFNTTDSGMIFVEPQTDEVVELKIGEHYWPEDYIVFGSDIIMDYGLIP